MAIAVGVSVGSAVIVGAIILVWYYKVHLAKNSVSSVIPQQDPVSKNEANDNRTLGFNMICIIIIFTTKYAIFS